MPGLFTTMFLVTAIASSAGGSAPYDAAFKCPARPGDDPDMMEWVLLVDLEMLEGDTLQLGEQLKALRSKEMGLWEIVCWEWVEANYGVEVRWGGVFILTKKWLEQTRQDRVAALEALVSAQDRHWEMTGGYAARVEDLPDFGALSDYGLPDHLQLDLSRTSGGWQARLEPEEAWFTGYRTPGSAYRCFAFAGEVPAGWESVGRDGQPGPGERKPECFKGEQGRGAMPVSVKHHRGA